MNIDKRAVIAADNNADLYEAVFSSQGLRYERLPFGFVARDQPPPYYAHLTTLSHKAQNDICRQFKDVVQRFSGRAVMKDSFCQMDAQSEGLEVLFDASWIWFGNDKQCPSCTWKRVKSNSDLQLWQDAWKQSGFPTDVKMFNETFLNKEDIFIFGQKNSGVFEKGCIGNRSRNCIGLSNVFSISRSSRIYDQATAAVASIDPRLPVVGYEASENLEAACRNGFEVVGNLRVLVAQNDRAGS